MRPEKFSFKQAYELISSEGYDQLKRQVQMVEALRKNRAMQKALPEKGLPKSANKHAKYGLERMESNSDKAIWNSKYRLKATVTGGKTYTFKCGDNFWIKELWTEPLGKSADRYWASRGNNYYVVHSALKQNYVQYIDIESCRTGKIVATIKLEVIRA